MFDDGLPRLDRAALSAVAGMLGAVSSTYCVCVRACVFPLSLEPSILLPSSLLDPSRAYTTPYLPPSVLPPFPRAHPFLGQENTSQENKAISRPGWTPRTYHGELNWGGGGGEGRRWRGVMRWGKGSSVTVCPCICIYGGGVIAAGLGCLDTFNCYGVGWTVFAASIRLRSARSRGKAGCGSDTGAMSSNWVSVKVSAEAELLVPDNASFFLFTARFILLFLPLSPALLLSLSCPGRSGGSQICFLNVCRRFIFLCVRLIVAFYAERNCNTVKRETWSAYGVYGCMVCVFVEGWILYVTVCIIL